MAENRRQSLKEQREQIKLEQVRYEATKKINDLLESGNDISKAYGVTLKEQLSDEGKVTNILKNRIDLTQQISDLKDEDIDHSEKAIKLNSKIKEVEEKLAGARDKKGKFQKGFNNLARASGFKAPFLSNANSKGSSLSILSCETALKAGSYTSV